jgi:hypothetical protein
VKTKIWIEFDPKFFRTFFGPFCVLRPKYCPIGTTALGFYSLYAKRYVLLRWRLPCKINFYEFAYFYGNFWRYRISHDMILVYFYLNFPESRIFRRIECFHLFSCLYDFFCFISGDFLITVFPAITFEEHAVQKNT